MSRIPDWVDANLFIFGGALKAMTMFVKMIAKLFLLVAFFMSSALFAQQTTFTATLSTSQADINQIVSVSYTLKSTQSLDIKSIEFPQLNGVQVVSRSTSQSSVYINGKSQRSKSWIFYLRMTQKGIITIPVVKLSVDGKTYQAGPLTIKVGASNKKIPNRQEFPDPNDSQQPEVVPGSQMEI